MDSKEEYIAYRIRKALETFEDARLLFENNRYDSAVNRLYYACFYCVNALLLRNGVQAHTHNGVKTLFFREFVKQELSDRNLVNYTRIFSIGEMRRIILIL